MWVFFTKLFKKRYSKQELKLYTQQAQGYLRIYNDSQKLFQTTKNPDVFFMRYDLAISNLEKLHALILKTDNAIKYKGDSITDMIHKLKLNRENQTTLFIERYFDSSKAKVLKLKTAKGMENNAKKSREEIMNYSSHLTEKQIERIDILWKTIKNRF
ncbi:MAG TPA: hypothetical protein VK094_04165 [Pseudogracilibacillus sp.]|nr:hypothetical protein [Pseudogracilibacillus sp.]